MPFSNAPSFFIKLYELLEQQGTDTTIVNSFGFRFNLTESGHCIDASEVSRSASKYRLAQNVTGLTATDYHEQTVRNYSGQIIISLSVVAFESYCRLFNKKWYKAYQEILCGEKAARAREQIHGLNLQDEFFLKLKRSQSDNSMKERIDKFSQGDDLRAPRKIALTAPLG